MKIVIDRNHLDKNFCDGLWNVADNMEEVYLWNSNQTPIYDVFDEYEPDVFIGNANYLSRGIVSSIKEFDCTALLYNNAYENLTEEEIKKIIDIKPQSIFNHRVISGLDQWANHKIPFHSILKAADLTINGKEDWRYQSEVSYVGSHHFEIDRNLDIIVDKQVRIYGREEWADPRHIGIVSNQEMADIYRSSLICPDFATSREISSRVFNILANNGFCISKELATHIFPANEIPVFSNPIEFGQLVKKYLHNPSLREASILAGKNRVLENHTYHHRLKQIREIVDV